MGYHLSTLLVYVVTAWILLVVAMIWSLTRINYRMRRVHRSFHVWLFWFFCHFSGS